MNKIFLFVITLLFIQTNAYALVISEIFSNPVGDDNGREWVELYNDTRDIIDLTTLSLSIKGATPIPVTSVSGSSLLQPGSYAIIGSTVSGVTRFLQDYPSYDGPLLKASMSLVNSGSTSLDVRINGVVGDAVASYTAAKEGSSLSKVASSYVVMSPTPGKENNGDIDTISQTATTTTGAQNTIAQSSPSADIIIYLPQDKTVVAGAPTRFNVQALTSLGKVIDNVAFSWSFGDGGQAKGSTTVYKYYHPGRYALLVDASNGLVAGKGRMQIRVVAPEVSLSPILIGEKDSYVEMSNPNTYELDISEWKLSFDGAMFSFPQNTILLPGVTKISGKSLGFHHLSSTTVETISLLFPDNQVLLYAKNSMSQEKATPTIQKTLTDRTVTKSATKVVSKSIISSSTVSTQQNKVRVVP
ncbi:MAG: hypothetical protein RI935_746 [Candidatus Parcubacteria bacterium]|jgi:hypothetical protein